MTLPPAIIFINKEINDVTKNTLVTQLFINETITGDEFNSRVSLDPDYSTNIKLQNLRILVIQDSFLEMSNRNLADVVMFVKQGMASIEYQNFGPPSLTLPINKINIFELLRFNKSPYVPILPNDLIIQQQYGLGGIFAIETRDSSGVHAPNPDNERNNIDFIKRK